MDEEMRFDIENAIDMMKQRQLSQETQLKASSLLADKVYNRQAGELFPLCTYPSVSWSNDTRNGVTTARSNSLTDSMNKNGSVFTNETEIKSRRERKKLIQQQKLHHLATSSPWLYGRTSDDEFENDWNDEHTLSGDELAKIWHKKEEKLNVLRDKARSFAFDEYYLKHNMRDTVLGML